MGVETDDTAFASPDQFKLTRPGLPPGVNYTAADGGPFVGTVELSTGSITPIDRDAPEQSRQPDLR
jgi:hypothetical protein